jgi:hypothetical protein
MSHDEPWLYRAAEWIENHWLEVCLGVNPLLLTIVSLACSDEIAGLIAPNGYVKAVEVFSALAIVGLVGLQIVLIVANHRHAERVSELRKEVGRLTAKGDAGLLQVRPLVFGYLKQLGEHDLDFGSKRGESERLTLYIHDDEHSVFRPISRFSNSPEFCTIPRQDYRDDHGCLSAVWSNGWHCAYDYPDPKSNFKGYLERSSRDRIPEATIIKMRMKPRLYCGTVIWNSQRTRQIGALLLEATNDRYQRSFLETFMKKQEQGYLGELLRALG